MHRSKDRPKLEGFEAGSWNGPEPRWRQPATNALEIEAPAGSDRFVDPATGARKSDSPAWLAAVAAPSTLVAHVRVGFRDTFDAGVLMAYERTDAWAKLCFERTPDGRRAVVSVVTRGTSDDANSWGVTDQSVWLRVSVLPVGYAFHASSNGSDWELVRLFRLAGHRVRRVGLSAQAPTGGGCSVQFDGVALRPGGVEDVRSGA